ncbi:ATPase family AAA domain-containing protein 2 [Schistosoma japonicum]|nr:ATPase family AAA domain-containing protein 2 [Schistosoma japonicum]
MRPLRRQSYFREKYFDVDVSKSTMNANNQSGPPLTNQPHIQLRKRGRPSKEKLVHFSQNSSNISSDHQQIDANLTKISPNDNQSYFTKKKFNQSSSHSSSSCDDFNSHYTHRELRPRQSTSNYYPQRKRRKRYPRQRTVSTHRNIVQYNVESTTLQDNLSVDVKPCPHSIQVQEDHNNAMLEDDDNVGGDDNDDEEEDDDQDGQQTRRYPVRNRKNTTVYQVENLHNNNNNNNHVHQRNWLAGTGYDKERRSRQVKSKLRKNLEHCGSSSTSSSSSSSSDVSDGSFCNDRNTIRRGWQNRWHCSTKENNHPLPIDKDEKRFERRMNKSIIHARSELMPINSHQLGYGNKSTTGDRSFSTTHLADIEPMSIDSSVGFEQVGGHEKHILALKESIILPLMYPEVFSKFNVDPPRGVLFSGPPGTGKTLLARALANECSRLAQSTTNDTIKHQHRRPIAFFMRKGADCLSKWVGESERQLRLLFDQAYRMRPSVIFFDEIDGLAPVRSSKQDQIHSSIVSTLLSLMDGLDNRAEVVIIGATNRPDAIDPALRRPGRFDREFIFTLPTESVRRRILDVITAKWDSKPDSSLLDQVATTTINFSGADLRALATEACLCCLRRCYPQVYNSQVKLALEHKYLVVSHSDWFEALQIVRASSERCDSDASASNLTPSANALAATIRTPLSPTLGKLLLRHVNEIVNYLTRILLCNPRKLASLDSNKESSSFSSGNDISSCIFKSKLFINGNISEIIMNAVWHKLEALQVFTINLANLFAFPTSIGMCPEAAVAQIISAIRHSLNNSLTTFNTKSQLNNGVIVYLPSIDVLLRSIPQLTATYLVDRLNALVDETNCDLSYIPSALINSDHSDPLNGASNNNDQLQYAAMRSLRRLIVVGTSAQQHSNCFPPKIATLTNVGKRNPYTKQYNTVTNTASSNTITTHDNCVSMFPNFLEKSHGGKCRITTSGGMNFTEKFTSPQPIHLKSSPTSVIPTVMRRNSTTSTATTTTTTTNNNNSSIHGNSTVGSDEHFMKYTYDHDLNSLKFQFTINLPEYRKLPSTTTTTTTTSLMGNSHILPLINTDLNINNENINHNLLDCTDLDDEYCLKPIDNSLTMHNNLNTVYVNNMLHKIFNSNHTEFIHLEAPNKDERLTFFTSVIMKWPQLTFMELLDIRDKVKYSSNTHIPSPQPVVEKDDVEQLTNNCHSAVNLSPEELAAIESKEMQLFRRLRQVLRRVVAHLASFRRFAVFTRPVQLDEAPDYYDVIKQPMDLGLIRDKIDSHQYANVNDFMKDIELVYQNALEYNPPNIPRSRDIRSRASEFWDEACLRIEEELQPADLNELCEEATQARAARLSNTQSNKTQSTSVRHSKTKGSEHQSPTKSYQVSQGKTNLKLPLPLPHGDRYSRRLHGESPILELSDILQLQSSNRRRRTASLNSSPLKSPSTQLQISQINSDLDMMSSPGVPLKSFEETDPSQLTINVESSVIFESPSEVSDQRKHQSSLMSNDYQISFETSSSPTTTTTTTTCTSIQVDMKKLSHFLDQIVLQTDGWTPLQLINLHRDFSNLVLCKYANVTNRMLLSDDFEKIFAIHQNAYL